MANRCKPGDLAVVVSAQHRCNLGRIVRVIELHDRTGPLVYASDLVVWYVECSEPIKWTLKSRIYKRKRGPVLDSALQPIRGLPARSTKHQSKELEAV